MSAFVVKAKIHGEQVWQFQWATVPTNEQIEHVTVDVPPGESLFLSRTVAHRVYDAVMQMRNDSAIMSIDYLGGLSVERGK